MGRHEKTVTLYRTALPPLGNWLFPIAPAL